MQALISFEIVILFFIDYSIDYIITINFFLISANLLGMFSSYFYELTLRMNFYHKNLLEVEKRKVERINFELEDRILRRTKELEKITNKAIESDKLKSMFLANISHEIRTPMNGILGFTTLLNNEELSPEKRKSYLEIISGRGEYLMEILNNLIEISMIESNSLQVKYEDIDLNVILTNLYKFLNEFFREKEITFVTDLPKLNENLIVRTDLVKLEQIITNLVTNASKYSSEGEVCLGYKINNKYLSIFVSDNGPGIPEHFRPYVFKSFVKNENMQEKFKQGAGLGLAISKGLAEIMGAKISYKSTVGEGTTFFLDFDKSVIVR